MIKREIIYLGQKYSIDNIMDKEKGFFSNDRYECAYCRKKIIVGVYSKQKESGYFRTCRGLNHEENCSWEKTKKYIPLNIDMDRLLKKYGPRKKNNKKESKSKVYKSSKEGTKIDDFDLSSSNSKPIPLGVKKVFYYNGKVNHVSQNKDFNHTFISLYVKNGQGNIRILAKGLIDIPTKKNLTIVVVNGVGINTLSKIHAGIDIDARNGTFGYKLHSK